MCNLWNECETLSKGTPFYWCRDEDGIIHVRSKGWLSAQDYEEMLNLVVENDQGTPLGARGDGNVPQNSLGAMLEARGKQRPLASYLAAIAVSEDLVEYENLGQGPGRGIWLFPASGEALNVSRQATSLLNTNVVKEADTDTFSIESVSQLVDSAAQSLRGLAERVENNEILEVRVFDYRLAEICLAEAKELQITLDDWDQAHPGSVYIYSFIADQRSTTAQCKKAFAGAKSAKNQNRKFARLNGGAESTRTLYVGSSRSLASRMKQHLGFSYPGIYSLQMSSWCAGLLGGFNIEILRLGADCASDVAQAIEDHLWSLSRPAFGRRGAR